MNEHEQRKIHLLIVDDHTLFRESLARLLQSEPGFEVVAGCGSGREACGIISRSKTIDVVLLDLDLGEERGTDLLDWLQRSDFDGKVLLVTASVTDSELSDLIRRGISGVFMKHGSPASLIQGIRDTVEGKVLFEQNLLRRAFQQTAAGDMNQSGSKLTEREKRVLSSVFEGLANQQIADRLQLSEAAVKSSLQRLFDKTGVRTRSQLVRVALERYRDQL